MQVSDNFKPHFPSSCRKVLHADKLDAKTLHACDLVHMGRGQVDTTLQVGANDKAASNLQVGFSSADVFTVGTTTSTMLTEHQVSGTGNTWTISATNPQVSTGGAYAYASRMTSGVRQSAQTFQMEVQVTETNAAKTANKLNGADIFTVQIMPPANLMARLQGYEIIPFATIDGAASRFSGSVRASKVSMPTGGFFIEVKTHWLMEGEDGEIVGNRPQNRINVHLKLIAPLATTSR